MASSINASTAGGGGVITTADASGNLNLQSGGSTVAAVSSTGVAVTGTLAATGAVSGTTGTFTSTLGVTGAITGSSTVAGSTGILYPLTSGTAVASTSGTSVDFTSIPSWVKRITVMFNGVSTNGTSNLLVQLGAGSVVTTGYTQSSTYMVNGGSNSASGPTSGFNLSVSTAASDTLYGTAVITLVGSNNYISTVNTIRFVGASVVGAGGITLSGAIDRLRLTSVNGTDTFDAGSVNILFE